MAHSYVDTLDTQSLASATLVHEPRQQAKKQREHATHNAPYYTANILVVISLVSMRVPLSAVLYLY